MGSIYKHCVHIDYLAFHALHQDFHKNLFKQIGSFKSFLVVLSEGAKMWNLVIKV